MSFWSEVHYNSLYAIQGELGFSKAVLLTTLIVVIGLVGCEIFWLSVKLLFYVAEAPIQQKPKKKHWLF